MPQEDLKRLFDRLGDDLCETTRTALSTLASDMQIGGTTRDEPVREIFGLLGDRWSTLILLVLDTGGYRHAALRRTINFLAHDATLSQRVLTLKLRALERDGLISRQISADIPPHVDYALTGLGRDLVMHVWSLIRWITESRSRIEAARVAFAGREGDKLP